MQVQSASMRSVAERITPSLLAALEPVALSEDLSRRLLLQKVLPNYPEQAVKARLQGPVVLEAWIGRDGSIQDLKLVRGSLLLGEAAYQGGEAMALPAVPGQRPRGRGRDLRDRRFQIALENL